MKVFIIFCLIAVCVSLPNSGIRIVNQDGVISITSSRNQLSIRRSTDPRKLELLYQTTSGAKNRLELSAPLKLESTDLKDFENKFYQKIDSRFTQFNLMKDILNNYEGMVDDVTYNKIIMQIEVLVNNGFLNQHMLTVLKYVELPEEIENVFGANLVDEPRILVSEIVMPMGGGVSRMLKISATIPIKETKNMEENSDEDKEELTVIPLEKDTSFGIGTQKYWPKNTGVPMQVDLMMKKLQNMYQQYPIRMDQSHENELSYQPMIFEQGRQTSMTPMQMFWKMLMVPRTQKEKIMFQYTFPQDSMYKFPVQRKVVPNMMDRTVMKGNMMYEPTMKHMMTPQMMHKYIMNENMMSPQMMEKDFMMYEPMRKDMMTENMISPQMMEKDVMMYDPMMKHMMTPQIMHKNMMSPQMMEKDVMMYEPMMKDMMTKNIMSPQMMDKDFMMYDPMMKHMMTPQIMHKNMMTENMMSPQMMEKDIMMYEPMMKDMMTKNMPFISSDMAQQMSNERLMDQRLMNEGIMN